MEVGKMCTENKTEMDFGKLHIRVHSVFSEATTETVVDKVRKLILQHSDDPHLSEKQLAIAREKSEYPSDKGGASGEETTGNERQNHSVVLPPVT